MKKSPSSVVRFSVTAIMLLLALAAILYAYLNYMRYPWTRDGQVKADIIQIAPRVAGPIVNLSVKDNQYVKAGNLLFEIDPSVYQKKLAQAKADLQELTFKATEAKKIAVRRAELIKRGAISIEKAEIDISKQQEAEAAVAAAQATLESAKLDLQYTKIYAPVDGYVTNLNINIGSFAEAQKPILAMVDTDTYWIAGYFKETQLSNIKIGDSVVVELMSYPDKPLKGVVHSIGWGIARLDGSPAGSLLPKVSATFDWIRLAQRVPVRIHLIDPPDDVSLIVGTTCSVALTEHGDVN